MTIDEFIAAHKITMRVERADKNPNFVGSTPEAIKWAETARHWRCEFRIPRRASLLTCFSQGPAYTKPPTAAEVLDSLASDCRGWSPGITFEEWARECGYNTDSRRAERIFRAAKENRAELYAFLGAPAFLVLLNKVDSL